MIPSHMIEKILGKFNRWRYEKPEKLGEELADKHLDIIRKATISWKEAIKQTDETYERLEKEIQEGFEAEACYWDFLNGN